MPFEVPSAIEAAIAMHVGRPNLRFPTPENASPVIFLSFVHLTTSQGACGDPVEPSLFIEKADDDCLECASRKAGEEARGEFSGEGVNRAWNRLSKGRREGVGLRLWLDIRIPLLGEDDSIEP